MSSTQTRQQYDQLAAHYPALVGPDDILAVVRSPADGPALADFADRVRGVPGVTEVRIEPVSSSVSLVRATPAHRPETPQGRATVTAVANPTLALDGQVTTRQSSAGSTIASPPLSTTKSGDLLLAFRDHNQVYRHFLTCATERMQRSEKRCFRPFLIHRAATNHHFA